MEAGSWEREEFNALGHKLYAINHLHAIRDSSFVGMTAASVRFVKYSLRLWLKP
jgi:hypothetical protein